MFAVHDDQCFVGFNIQSMIGQSSLPLQPFLLKLILLFRYQKQVICKQLLSWKSSAEMLIEGTHHYTEVAIDAITIPTGKGSVFPCGVLPTVCLSGKWHWPVCLVPLWMSSSSGTTPLFMKASIKWSGNYLLLSLTVSFVVLQKVTQIPHDGISRHTRIDTPIPGVRQCDLLRSNLDFRIPYTKCDTDEGNLNWSTWSSWVV